MFLYRIGNFGVKTTGYVFAIKIICMEKHNIHLAKLQLKKTEDKRHSYNTWKEGRVTFEDFKENESSFSILACLFLAYRAFLAIGAYML